MFFRRRPLRLLLLVALLLWEDDYTCGRLFIHAQQEQNQPRQRRQRRPRVRPSSSNDDDDSSSNPFGQMPTTTNMNMTSLAPRHVLEGLWNTVRISGLTVVLGAVSLIGIPLVAVLYGDRTTFSSTTTTDSMESSSSSSRHANTATNTTSSSWGKRLVAGSLVGGFLATVCWISAAIYGVYQVVVGTWVTVPTLTSWWQGKTYWNDGMWQVYNLTRAHDLLLQEPHGDSHVYDDSYYTLLGVSTTATSKEIKRAYYQLAKEYHPDKQKPKKDDTDGEPQVDTQELFLQLHHAYETLYDAETRARYDEFGPSASSSTDSSTSAADLLQWDTNIFFDVLFGWSPVLEGYMGDLTIKHVFAHLMKTIRAVQLSSTASNPQQVFQEVVLPELMEQLWGTKGQAAQERRQVEIAIYLQDLSRDFVNGTMTKVLFQEHVQHHVTQVLEASPMPVFVESIARALTVEGSRSWNNPLWDLPRTLWTRLRSNVWDPIDMYSWYSRQIVQLYRAYQTQQEVFEQEQKDASPNTSPGEWLQEQWRQELKKPKQQERLVNKLMEFVWKYNQRDIRHAIQGACWKLLHTNTYTSSKQKRRQVQAIRIMAKEFRRQIQQQQQDESCPNEDNANTNHKNDDDMMARIQMALDLSMSKEEKSKQEEKIKEWKDKKQQAADEQAEYKAAKEALAQRRRARAQGG